VLAVTRRYRGDTLVLETDMTTASGTVRIVDAMSPRPRENVVLRLVEGVRGRVPMRSETRLRFDYGSGVPWARRVAEHTLTGVAGPDAVSLHTTAPLQGRGQDMAMVADFTVGAGQSVPFSLTWYPSYAKRPPAIDVRHCLDLVGAWWAEWMATCR